MIVADDFLIDLDRSGKRLLSPIIFDSIVAHGGA
jgi:hypothetical protein